MSGVRAAKKRETRQAILQAAIHLFAEKGFDGTSIEDVARAARVGKGTVYLACDSKEDLFFQSVHRDLRAWIGEVAKMLDPRVPADELLETISVASIRYMEQRPLVRGLITGIYSGKFPGWTARFEELRSLGHANIVEILKLGVRQGRFRDDLDIDSAASVMQDFQTCAYMHLAHGDGPAPDELLARLRVGLDLVLNGLRRRGEPGPAA